MSTASFLQRYKILNKIGEGSFSEVLKCKDLRHGIYLAAKRLKKRFNRLEDVFGSAEIIAMQKLSRHPNILYMTEFHFDSMLGQVTFLFELMDMSLYDFINARSRPVLESKAKHYLFQILCGLDHLHRNGIFHRDIKPENILIKMPPNDDFSDSTKHETIKIGDLGSIRGVYSTPPFTEYISTRWYRSPECLLTCGYYGSKMDIWATGCVYFELLTFKPLFAGSNEVDQLSKIHDVLGTPSTRVISKFLPNKSCNFDYFPKRNGTGLTSLIPNISSEGLSVLRHMVTYDPDSRANVKRLLEHKYFSHLKYMDRTDKIHSTRKRASSVVPIGDHKVAKKPNIKIESKSTRRHCADETNSKKFKISGSHKSLFRDHKMNKKSGSKKPNSMNSNVKERKLNISRSTDNHRKLKSNSYRTVEKEMYISKEPKVTVWKTKYGKTTYETYTGLRDSQESKKPPQQPHSYALRKYSKVKKETESYRNTTGHSSQVFNKSANDKPKYHSKSFVFTKTPSKRSRPSKKVNTNSKLSTHELPTKQKAFKL